MKKIFNPIIVLALLSSCQNNSITIAGTQSQAIVELIEAVNEKDAQKYVQSFSPDVKIILDSEVKVDGKTALQENRSKHFDSHPEVRSEIQHLVEIDDKVILHDKVWLNKNDKKGRDIVEIFTFQNGKIIQVEVIQPSNLFEG